MLARLRPRSVYDVLAAIACFGVLAGGTAYAANTIGSNDVINDSLLSEDIKQAALKGGDIAPNTISSTRILDDSLGSVDIKDGSLDDEDIGQGTFVNFDGDIGNVPASGCVNRLVTGVNAQFDHVLLTPNYHNATRDLSYSVRYSTQTGALEGFVSIHVCNPTAQDINDGITSFNMLVIDSQ
jgi:hypothetical protein